MPFFVDKSSEGMKSVRLAGSVRGRGVLAYTDTMFESWVLGAPSSAGEEAGVYQKVPLLINSYISNKRPFVRVYQDDLTEFEDFLDGGEDNPKEIG